MEIIIKLTKYADVPFIKKLLSQIKGIENIEILDKGKPIHRRKLRTPNISRE